MGLWTTAQDQISHVVYKSVYLENIIGETFASSKTLQILINQGNHHLYLMILPTFFPDQLPFFNDYLTIEDNIFYTNGELLRVVEPRPVFDTFRIENYHIGKIASLSFPLIGIFRISARFCCTGQFFA